MCASIRAYSVCNCQYARAGDDNRSSFHIHYTVRQLYTHIRTYFREIQLNRFEHNHDILFAFIIKLNRSIGPQNTNNTLLSIDVDDKHGRSVITWF